MGDTGAYLDRADVRMKAGQYDQAIADYTKVIEHSDTTNASVRRENAYQRRAFANAMNFNAHNCRDDFRLAAQSRREQQAKDK
jgi:tetratricopeptide (TPR) repeat protein